jgi:hypothetical protein
MYLRKRAPAFFVLGAVLLAGCGGSSGGGGGSTSTASRPPSASSLAPIHGTYSPKIEPANFVTTIDNRFWPLRPGTAYHYVGVRGTTPQRDDEVVTHMKKTILGIPSTVVRDTVSEHGVPVERTFDWYAQDKQGNVWYMGELSLEKKNGKFAKASDSW